MPLGITVLYSMITAYVVYVAFVRLRISCMRTLMSQGQIIATVQENYEY